MKLRYGLINVANAKRLFARPYAMAFFVLGLGAASTVLADLDDLIKAEQSKLKIAQQSQKRVDALEEERRKLYNEYKVVLKEIDGLKVFNAQMGKQIANQIKEMGRIQQNIDNITVMQRQITPLMLRMIEGLEQFIALDIPFLKEERESRLNFLKELLDRSDVSVAEKFRRVVEAYKTENDYGSKLDVYKGTELVDGVEREVDYLKFGRIAWVYLTPDGKYSASWNHADGVWEELPGAYRNHLREGLKIANKQATVNLIVVPVKAPESVQ